MRDLITHLSDVLSWPSLLAIFVALLPKFLERTRGLIHAWTFRKLGQAVIEKANWADKATVDGVLELMTNIDRNSVPGATTNVAPNGRPAGGEPHAEQ